MKIISLTNAEAKKIENLIKCDICRLQIAVESLLSRNNIDTDKEIIRKHRNKIKVYNDILKKLVE